MKRRIDRDTAQQISIVLLTRVAFGTTAGLRTAVSYGLRLALIKAIFLRPLVLTRIHLDPGARRDRRKWDRWRPSGWETGFWL